MSNYDLDYFFLRQPKGNEKLPFLIPDASTEDRKFRSNRQPLGSPPLFFHNAWRAEVKKRGVHTIVPPVLFSGADIIIATEIRNKLLALELSGLSLHPAVYVDDQDIWHEDYWFVTFTEELDCWDRATSYFEEEVEPVTVGGETLYQVYEYRLDAKILDAVPLERRLLFKMGGTLKGMVVCHKSLIKIFTPSANAGLDIVGILDY